MRRITLWLLATFAAVVLLFSYRTSTMGRQVAPPATAIGGGGGTGDTGDTGGKVNGAKTFQGSVAQTRWGPVQVAIAVAGGKITAVEVPTYPDGNNRDRQINAYALPILKQQTLAAQSADIDTVSGATVTSEGYIESLQAALDAAHLS
jgi:FMN-binding protein